MTESMIGTVIVTTKTIATTTVTKSIAGTIIVVLIWRVV
jgi:hypothetical protein